MGSGNKEIENSQHRITMILKSLGIAIELCDISAPGMEEQRDFMRANAVRRRVRGTCSHPKSSTGRSIVGTMMLLTSPTKTMSLRSSLESQGNTQRLSRPRRSPPRRAKMRPSRQRVKPRKEKQRLRERERLLRKVLLLQKARPLLQRKHPQRSREMCDSSLSVKGGEGEAAAPKSPHCCATSPFIGRVFVEIFLCVTLSPMSS